MSDNFGLLFDGNSLGRQVGSGTDGRVYRLEGNDNGKASVVKIIRLNHEKILQTRQRKRESLFSYTDEEYCAAFIKNITDNIDLISSYDAGKHFVPYLGWECRPGDDGKSTLLLIRLEELTPLSEFMNEFSLTLEEVLRVSLCLCSALCVCRSFGFIYPNIKPENVMFDSMGRCLLADFGTFCCTPPLKTSLAYKRTQQYMAPEFYQSEKINETCDIYSLGLIMYALLNRGRLPFLPHYPSEITMNDLTTALQRRISGETIPPPRLADDATARVILKALSFQPEHRYTHPRRMLSDIQKLLRGEEVSFEQEPADQTAQQDEQQHMHIPQSDEPDIPGETSLTPEPNDTQPYEPDDTEVNAESAQPDIPQPKQTSTTESSQVLHRLDKVSAIHHSYKKKKSSALSLQQKIVLAMLCVALIVLGITVIVLAVKYSQQEALTMLITMINDKQMGVINWLLT